MSSNFKNLFGCLTIIILKSHGIVLVQKNMSRVFPSKPSTAEWCTFSDAILNTSHKLVTEKINVCVYGFILSLCLSQAFCRVLCPLFLFFRSFNFISCTWLKSLFPPIFLSSKELCFYFFIAKLCYLSMN